MGTTEDEMVGRHHRLDGHEFEQAPGVADGQGSLACCSPWGCKELGMVLEKTLESLLDCKESQPAHSKGDQSWVFFGRNDAKAETPVLWPLHAKS